MSGRYDRLTELMIVSQREFRNVIQNGSVFHIKKCAYRIVNMVLNSLKVGWISSVNPEKQFAIAGCDVIS